MSIITVTKNSFPESVLGASKPVLLDFWAPWCTYCRRIEPSVEKIAEQYQDTIITGKVNVDEESELAIEYKVTAIPTLILLKEGKVAGTIVAPDSKGKIDDFLKEYL